MNQTSHREASRPIAVAFQDADLLVTLADGRRIATPLAWYPRLETASAADRADVELTPLGVHWPRLDEDLSVEGMPAGRPTPTIR